MSTANGKAKPPREKHHAAPSEQQLAFHHDAALGKSAAEIARSRGVSVSLVEEGLECVEASILKDYTADSQRGLIRQTELLNWICRESLRAWEASQQPQESTKVSTDGSGPESKTKAERTTRQQPGDPRYLSHAMAAMAAVRRIWGLDEPQPASAAPHSDKVRVLEDEDWYGNSAHGLSAQAAAASDSDLEVVGST